MTVLVPLVAAELETPVDEAIAGFAQAIAERCGGSAQAVLFYGSCLRNADLADSLLDFYLLVDAYDRAYARRWLATANRLIPPNVFYIEHAGLRALHAAAGEPAPAVPRRLSARHTGNRPRRGGSADAGRVPARAPIGAARPRGRRLDHRAVAPRHDGCGS